MGPLPTLLLAHQFSAVPTDVQAIEGQVGGHQNGIEDIEPNDNVVTVQCLVDDTENVTQYHQRHEERTFADDDFGSYRLGDGNGPADRETEQKEYFPNAEICHIYYSYRLENVVFTDIMIVRTETLECSLF